MAPGGSWGSQRPSLAYYVKLTGTKEGVTASGCRSCWLSSDVVLGSHSVYTSTQALREAEARISAIQTRLIQQGRL